MGKRGQGEVINSGDMGRVYDIVSGWLYWALSGALQGGLGRVVKMRSKVASRARSNDDILTVWKRPNMRPGLTGHFHLHITAPESSSLTTQMVSSATENSLHRYYLHHSCYPDNRRS